MEIQRYTKEYDCVLLDWLSYRNLDTSVVEDLPELGFLVTKDRKPIAAGFIRRIEGGHALLDSYVTDPDADAKDRDFALDVLTAKLICEAKSSNIKQLLALTTYSNIAERAIVHGFVPQIDSLLVKVLHNVRRTAAP